MRRPALIVLALGLVAVTACTGPAATAPGGSVSGSARAPGSVSASGAPSVSRTPAGGLPVTATPVPARPRSTVVPTLSVQVVASGLQIPWGMGFTPDGTLLFTERSGRLSLISDPARPGDARVTAVDADLSDVRAEGEGGLLDLALSPGFASDRRIFLCFNTTEGDIKVVPFTMGPDLATARREQPLLSGIPANPSGRHSECRIAFLPDATMLIGTGDTADGPVPQDLTSLGGKLLRIDPATGDAPADNPFAGDPNRVTRLVHGYGHRNIQGIAIQPGTGQAYTVEHGPDRDDEVNRSIPGANYGWDPDSRGSYDESVPMTDPRLGDNVVAAVWSSGYPTIATSGADFVSGRQWGAFEGRLMVAALKGERLLAMDIDQGGTLLGTLRIPELDNFGRLRTVRLAPDGSLYVTTSNGDSDRILRVTARS